MQKVRVNSCACSLVVKKVMKKSLIESFCFVVTIAALPNTPAYDLDTLLFLDNGKRPLGFVFDVLGQVTSPIYAIRFNSVDDIKNLQIQVGTKVYSAPTSKHTQYVFLQQLLK